MTDEQFLEQTPYTLDLLIRRLEHEDFKQFHIAAIETSLLANIHRDRKEKPDPFDVWDFIPRCLWPDEMKAEPRFDSAGNVSATDMTGMTAQQKRDFLRSMFVIPKRKVVKKNGRRPVKARS